MDRTRRRRGDRLRAVAKTGLEGAPSLVLMKNTFKIALGGTLGFMLFQLMSHPHSHVHKKIPPKKIKNIHLLPHIKIQTKEKHIHLHHWMNLGSLYITSLVLKKLRKSHLYHGFMLGSILQGLHYKDRFQIIKKLEEIIE